MPKAARDIRTTRDGFSTCVIEVVQSEGMGVGGSWERNGSFGVGVPDSTKQRDAC